MTTRSREDTRARWISATVIAATAAVVLAPAASGQRPGTQNAPRAGYVYPAGGQQGTSVRLLVGGQFLDGASEVLVAGSDLRATVVRHDRPLSAQQQTALREQIQALQPKAGADPAVREQILALRTQLGDTVRRNRNPALAELLTIDVTIAAEARTGARQLRVRTPQGLSNPLTFVIGQLPEAAERDVKATRADAELAVTLPVTVNGRLIPGDIDNARLPLRQATQYMPGDVDRYRFSAAKDQHLVISVEARELMPYLADAVPGWLQTIATLFDGSGGEVAFCDDHQFRPDPLLHYEVPADGEYILEIRDALYRGREDFVYRASIGELPIVTSVFPLGGQAGTRTTVELSGWNLRSTRAVVQPVEAAGETTVVVREGGIDSNARPFAADTLPEMAEREPNNARNGAQPVSLPATINGRIREPGDWDVFSFRGRAGDAVVAEVIARRLESPLDSVLEITDARGQRVAFSDDREDKAAGRLTHHADSYVLAALPAEGTYFVRISDVQRRGGLEFGYRLRLSAPLPDFALRISPSSLNAANGAHVPVTVTAIRADGFSGEIALALEGAPEGYVLKGGMIPAGQDRIRLTIAAPATGRRQPDHLRIVGRATVHGRTIKRTAVPADERQQAFAYQHLVQADAFRVARAGRGGTRMPIRVLAETPIRLVAAGAPVRVHVTVPAAYQTFENIQFELVEPPPGITIGGVIVAPGRAGASFVLQATEKATPGLRGNLIVIMTGVRVTPAGTPDAARRRVPVAVLPAIEFEVPTRAGRAPEPVI